MREATPSALSADTATTRSRVQSRVRACRRLSAIMREETPSALSADTPTTRSWIDSGQGLY